MSLALFCTFCVFWIRLGVQHQGVELLGKLIVLLLERSLLLQEKVVLGFLKRLRVVDWLWDLALEISLIQIVVLLRVRNEHWLHLREALRHESDFLGISDLLVCLHRRHLAKILLIRIKQWLLSLGWRIIGEWTGILIVYVNFVVARMLPIDKWWGNLASIVLGLSTHWLTILIPGTGIVRRLSAARRG